jgi:hypothetical protein
MRQLFLLTILSALIVVSCKKKDENSMVALSEQEALDLQAVIDRQIDSVNPGAINNPIRKEWKRLNDACFKNDFFKSPNYFGLTNTYGIGCLVDTRHSLVLKDLRKIIPAGDFAKFMPQDVPFAAICSDVKSTNLQIGVLLNAIISKLGDPDLAFKIKSCKNAKLTTGEWRQLIPTAGDLFDYIDSSKAPGMDSYRKYRDQKDAYMVVGVLEVSNFSADLSFESDLEAELEAKFKGDTLKVENPNSLDASVTLKKSGTRKVQIKCNSMFVPLVVLHKRKK